MWYIDTLSAGKYGIRCPMYERLVPWLDMCWVLPRRQMQFLHHGKWNMCWKLLILNNYSITTIAFWISDIKVILHQFWVKKIFPWKFHLQYSGTFTKLFMHVSSRNMFPATRNLQICVHVYQYRPRHCVVETGCFVPMIAEVIMHTFPGLTLEGDSGEEVALTKLWRLTSLSHWSKAKFKSPYVATRVFSPLVKIYENVDIVHMFVEIYRIHY
jgi:hypothetical protein